MNEPIEELFNSMAIMYIDLLDCSFYDLKMKQLLDATTTLLQILGPGKVTVNQWQYCI